LVRGPEGTRADLLYMLSRTISNHPTAGADIAKEIGNVLLDLLTASQHPMDVRCKVFAIVSPPESAELRKKFLEFCHQVLKEKRTKFGDESAPLPEAVRWLLQYLPADSKDLAEVMDIACQHGCISSEAVQSRQAELRGPAVAAALRGLKEMKSVEGPRNQHLSILEQFATPAEKSALGEVIEALPPETPIRETIDLYMAGLAALPEADQAAAWESLGQLVERAPSHIQPRLLETLVGMEGDRVAHLMTWAADSKNAETRLAAFSHCAAQVQIHPGTRTQTLLKGLKDPAEANQMAALIGLSQHPDLDAVPSIIASLNSAFADVRKQARESLDEIKKHFEAQAEWQRWYDETKKTLKR